MVNIPPISIYGKIGDGLLSLFYPYYPVGGLNPSEKDSSVGMMNFPIYGKVKVKAMFQTTNQYIYLYYIIAISIYIYIYISKYYHI